MRRRSGPSPRGRSCAEAGCEFRRGHALLTFRQLRPGCAECPHPLPQRAHESRVTALSKIAVSAGKPTLFSVRKRTASACLCKCSTALDAPIQCPPTNNTSVHRQISTPRRKCGRATLRVHDGNECTAGSVSAQSAEKIDHRLAGVAVAHRRHVIAAGNRSRPRHGQMPPPAARARPAMSSCSPHTTSTGCCNCARVSGGRRGDIARMQAASAKRSLPGWSAKARNILRARIGDGGLVVGQQRIGQRGARLGRGDAVLADNFRPRPQTASLITRSGCAASKPQADKAAHGIAAPSARWQSRRPPSPRRHPRPCGHGHRAAGSCGLPLSPWPRQSIATTAKPASVSAAIPAGGFPVLRPAGAEAMHQHDGRMAGCFGRRHAAQRPAPRHPRRSRIRA